MIPLVLFDLDGTLVDSFRDIQAGIQIACTAIGLTPDDALMRLCTRGAPLEEFYRLGTGEDPVGTRFDCFVDGYRSHYVTGCVDSTTPFPGVVELLRALRARPDRPQIGVATTKRTDSAERVLHGTGLLPLIDFFSGSDGLQHKPAPDVLQKVAGMAGIPVARAIMVGDTDRDLGAARAAGCPSVGVTWGGFARDELAALGADWIIDQIGELYAIVTS